MGAFERYAPFVQDFIYSNGWEDLRSIQVAAADAIFNTDENVLLTASTASGKTEAAFFPILTELWEDPPASIGAIYVAPLKALINDQFIRLNDLCDQAGIPVWHWHGDVAASHKRKMLAHPSGVLQITPESLEALLMHRHTAVPRLFCDLRYVVIDEVHSLLRGDRGGQTLCLIERLARMAGVNPRRIGLSATIGEPQRCGDFLSSGTGRGCIIPRFEEPRRTWRLSMEHFYVTGPQADERARQDGAPIEADVVSCVRVGGGLGGATGDLDDLLDRAYGDAGALGIAPAAGPRRARFRALRHPRTRGRAGHPGRRSRRPARRRRARRRPRPPRWARRPAVRARPPGGPSRRSAPWRGARCAGAPRSGG